MFRHLGDWKCPERSRAVEMHFPERLSHPEESAMFARTLARVLGTKTLTPNRNALRFRPRVEGLERRDVPVVMWSVDTTGDLNDVNLADGLPADMTSSMAHDLDRGNALEVNWLSGGVVKLGKEKGVPTPANSAVCDILALQAAGRK